MVRASHQEEPGMVSGRVRIRIRHVCRILVHNTWDWSPTAPDTFSNILIQFPRMDGKVYHSPTLESGGSRECRGPLGFAVVNSELIYLVVESMGWYHREMMQVLALLCDFRRVGRTLYPQSV